MDGKLFVYIYALFICWVFWFILRGRVEYVKDRGELLEKLENLYGQFSGYIFVLAGEANKSMYEKLYSVVRESIRKGEVKKLKIVVGPEISIYPEDRDCLDSEGKAKNIECFKNLHPLFKLLSEFPEKIEVYYKIDNSLSNQRHFVLMIDFFKSYLYVEALHKPLQESRAILIHRPNVLEIIRYLLKFFFIIYFKKVERISLNETSIRKVRFSDFSSQIQGEFCAGGSL